MDLKKLKPGTKVLIRKDLEVGPLYGNNSVVQPMLVNAGKVVTIKSDYYEYGYLIEEGMFQYTPEMIECVVQPNK